MRKLFLCTIIINWIMHATAQQALRENKRRPNASPGLTVKPYIDDNALSNWVSFGQYLRISNDGKYFGFTLTNQISGSNTLVIQSTEDVWKREFPGFTDAFFCEDNRQLVCLVRDSLCFLKLGADVVKCIPGVTSYKQPEINKEKWLACQLKGSGNELLLYNLLDEKEQRFPDVADYLFDDKGSVLLLKTITQDKGLLGLKWVDLESGKIVNIWSGGSEGDTVPTLNGYCIDASGTQVAFSIQGRKGTSWENGIWYYKQGMDKAVTKVVNQSAGIEPGLSINRSIPVFSKDGRYIFFQLQDPELPKPGPNDVKMDVWSYQDTLLQSTQLFRLTPQVYTAAMGVKDDQVIRLERRNEKIKAYPVQGDFIVLESNTMGDKFWLGLCDKHWLVSLRDGQRIQLETTGCPNFVFSPAGNYLVYFDAEKKGNYYSYDLRTGRVKNISATVPPGILTYKDEYRRGYANMLLKPVGIGGWKPQDRAIYVYDNYDIWQLDLAGTQPPLNITNGYGNLQHVKFRLLEGALNDADPVIIQESDSLMLTAFNTVNKYGGFYRIMRGQEKAPHLLVMGPWTFYPGDAHVLPMNPSPFDDMTNNNSKPVKAKHATAWVVQRQSAVEAPNYFLTTDFKTYKSLTRIQPQQEYNWLTAELVSWKLPDGTPTQGVLYKPENFDKKKKYPVLLNYYQQLSHRLNQYPTPSFTRSNINIAWFVSRGYLVLTPDIHFTAGRPGASACNAVVTAAHWLSRLPYVDPKRMGINGHSFGGFETNYIVTHTDLFAAAIEGAGTSDCVSSSLQLTGDNLEGASRLGGFESDMGCSLWERPDLYLDNSPILKAHEVKTPLLIMHNKIDGGVPWAQAVEMFIALRRLGKPVWMLQYDECYHVLYGKEAKDFTIRVTQFFDHYLKGAPPPIWMTKGIPARLRGIASGYEIDTGKK